MIKKFDRLKFMRLAGIMYLACGISGFIPIFYVLKYFDPKYIDEFSVMPWAVGGAFYIGGCIIFMFKLPERFYPRTFDQCVSLIFIIFI
jgi:predicted membrane channel-forming protein YqfA (hemolysin III family)